MSTIINYPRPWRFLYMQSVPPVYSNVISFWANASFRHKLFQALTRETQGPRGKFKAGGASNLHRSVSLLGGSGDIGKYSNLGLPKMLPPPLPLLPSTSCKVRGKQMLLMQFRSWCACYFRKTKKSCTCMELIHFHPSSAKEIVNRVLWNTSNIFLLTDLFFSFLFSLHYWSKPYSLNYFLLSMDAYT